MHGIGLLQRFSRDIAALAVMGTVTLLLFNEFLRTGLLVSTGDLTGSTYPVLDFISNEIRAGRLPTWDPYAGGGHSLLGVVAPTFYPFIAILSVLPTALAIGWSFIIAIMVAGTGTYLLGRQLGLSRSASLVAGLSLMFSGYLFNRLFAGHFGSLLTMVWLPWVLLFAERALAGRMGLNVALGGLVLGIHFSAATAAEYVNVAVGLLLYTPLRALYLAGLPHDRALVGLFSGSFLKSAVTKMGRATLAVILMVVIGGALGAPVLVPLFEGVAVSVRSGGLNYSEATVGSLTFPHLLSFLIRNLYGSEADDTSWYGGILHETTGYVGVLPLVLAVYGIIRRSDRAILVFVVVGGFALLASLGSNTPLYQFLYKVPPFNLVRVPSRFLWLYAFALSMLAGYGVDALRSAKPAALVVLRRWVTFCAVNVALIVVLLGVGLQFIPFPPKMEAARTVIPWTMASGGLATILILVATSSLIHWRSRRLSDRSLAVGVIAIILVDLSTFDLPMIKMNDPARVYSANRTETFLRETPGLYRVMDLGYTLTPYLGMLDRRIQDVENDWALTYLRYWEWINQDVDHKDGIPGDSRGGIDKYNSKVARLLSVRFVFSDRPLEDTSLNPVTSFVDSQRKMYVWPSLERPAPVWVYEVKDTLPRAFTVHQVVQVRDSSTAFRTVSDPAFDLRGTAVLEEPFDALLPADPPRSREAAIEIYEPSRIQVQVEMTSPGFLVMSEVNYPGWVAKVDGSPAKLWKTDFLLRGIYLPAGLHRVELIYEPESLRIGLMVGAVALTGVGLYLGYLALAAVGRRRRQERGVSTS